MAPYLHNQADALASYFHEIINKVLKSDWRLLFWNSIEQLSSWKNIDDAARELWEDTDYLAKRLLKPCPSLEDLPRLRAQIRMEYQRLELPQDWERFICTKVLPRLQDREDISEIENEAIFIRESILGFQDSLLYILDTIKALLGESDKPCFSGKFDDGQIKAIYTKMSKAGYIAEGTWDDFYRCFDYYTPVPGWIHWIKENTVKNKNHPKIAGKEISKRPIIFFLIYFNIPSTMWRIYATTLFHVELTKDDVDKVERKIKRKEIPGPPFWDLDRIVPFEGKRYWEYADND